MVTHWIWLRHAPLAPAAMGTIADPAAEADLSDELTPRRLARCLPSQALWLCSPLARTRASQKALTHVRPLIEPAFVEQDFGDWAGRRWDELGDASVGFWLDPARTAPPGGESFETVCARVSAAIERLSDEHHGMTLIVMAHAGVVRAAVAHALGLPPERALAVTVDPWSRTVLDDCRPGWRVGGVNIPAP